MIDAHIHVARPRLPGVGPLNPLLEQSAEVVAEGLRLQMDAAGITRALAMGCWYPPESHAPDDPLGVTGTLAVARLVPGLFAVGVADPTRADPDHLRRVESFLATGRVRALKAYLGYLHYPADHPAYRPYYELAERFQVPVVFHTGDTYSPYAKLRFTHPLAIDDLAVDHPRVSFVLAHFGNPWLTDAAEVVYKNMNVWADLSGLAIGDAAAFADPERQEGLQEVVAGVGRAFRFAERPNRFLYGSDWPLAPMPAYRAFIASAIPEVYHPQVFEGNARTLFRI
jgi:predicted TIM-barrel fold metal-dependent hydrolase